MPLVFTQKLAERFTAETPFQAREALKGDALEPGHLYVAPGDFHMTVFRDGAKKVLRLDQSPPVHFCRPAVDPLFESVATCYGQEAVAVVLTGMGEDGRRGAEALVEAGGRVFVQDEDSSVVWGMPGAVAKAGLATAMHPPARLADELKKTIRR